MSGGLSRPARSERAEVGRGQRSAWVALIAAFDFFDRIELEIFGEPAAGAISAASGFAHASHAKIVCGAASTIVAVTVLA